jgi:hypothetical protein
MQVEVLNRSKVLRSKAVVSSVGKKAAVKLSGVCHGGEANWRVSLNDKRRGPYCDYLSITQAARLRKMAALKTVRDIFDGSDEIFKIVNPPST